MPKSATKQQNAVNYNHAGTCAVQLAGSLAARLCAADPWWSGEQGKGRMRNTLLVMAVGLCLICPYTACPKTPEGPGSFFALFDEICQIVEDNFYNASLIREQFPQLKAEYRKKMGTVSTQADFSAMVNTMLAQLNASHTYYLSPHDYEYYHLAAVFSSIPAVQTLFHDQGITYPTVGIITQALDNRTFIASVLPGSVAEEAGLLSGDEIVAANHTAYQPIDSLQDHVGRQVVFAIRRSAAGTTRTFPLIPVRKNPKEEMLEAEQASIRLIETGGHTLGYIHIYSYAGTEYHDELISAITAGKLKDADGLIIDLRYGLGGADPSYLNVFNRRVPVLTSTDHSGRTYRYDPQWRRPAVFLVNKTTRSGKEILAFGAKQYRLAAVIGERTAGAVLGATLFPLSNADLLYLAVRSNLADNVDLEGVGVAPDIEVPMDIRYCEGKDPQLERAAEYLLETLRSQ